MSTLHGATGESGSLHGRISGGNSLRGSTYSKLIYADAYNIACAHGFVGTVEEWLASLKGETGATGPKGEKGNDGQPGSSPMVKVTSISGGHRVTITSEAGASTFDVMDGVTTLNPSDVDMVVSKVLAELPVYDGEVIAV